MPYDIIVSESSVFFFILYDYVTMAIIYIWLMMMMSDNYNNHMWYHTITLTLNSK